MAAKFLNVEFLKYFYCETLTCMMGCYKAIIHAVGVFSQQNGSVIFHHYVYYRVKRKCRSMTCDGIFVVYQNGNGVSTIPRTAYFSNDRATN